MSYIQKLIDTQDNIIIICDNKFNIKYYNKVFLKFFKKHRLEDIINLVKENKFKSFNKKLKNFEGHKFTFSVCSKKIDDDIIINLKDLTGYEAYKKSLLTSNVSFLEYKKLIDKFLIVSTTDKDGIITYVNQKFVKISGYSKDELIGNPHNIVRHPDMPQYVFRNMWNTISRGNIWQGVVKNRKKNGEPYFVKTIIAPFMDSNNKIKEYVALRVDITELIKAKEKAQKEKKSKEMFLANMSHEIRTPLTGMMGFIDVLKEKDLDSETKKIVDIIDNSADTLLNVVNDILDLSKIETEGVTIHLDEFYAKSSFENTIALFQAKAQEKNISYISNIDVDECIVSDEHRLKQVLSNLIGNAIKFTPENGEVKVDITSKTKNNKVIIDFSVEDSGIGIPKAKQKRLFKAYSQIDSEKFGGTGLGLYISAQIVQKLGGKLQVISEENKGSKFYFSLEFTKCEKIDKKSNNNVFVTGKILVAEDDKVIQEYLKALLKTKGNIDITIVDNGYEALEMFKKDKFDLVFLDSFMPKMKGEEALNAMLKYEKEKNIQHTPILSLSANALKGEISKKFDDYLLKPIDNNKLDIILTKYLSSTKKEEISLDDDLLNELRELYFQNIYSDLDSLKESIKSNNLDQIMAISHKIAGSSFTVGFDSIAKLAKSMENSVKNKENVDYFKLFDKIQNQIKMQRR